MILNLFICVLKNTEGKALPITSVQIKLHNMYAFIDTQYLYVRYIMMTMITMEVCHGGTFILQLSK